MGLANLGISTPEKTVKHTVSRPNEMKSLAHVEFRVIKAYFNIYRHEESCALP